MLAQPHPKGIDQRSGTGLTLGQALLGRSTADIGLDGVQLGNPAQPLGRDRGLVAVEGLAELSPGARSTQGKGERVFGPSGEPVVTAIPVHLQMPVKPLRKCSACRPPRPGAYRYTTPGGSGPLHPRSSWVFR